MICQQAKFIFNVSYFQKGFQYPSQEVDPEKETGAGPQPVVRKKTKAN